MRGNSLQAHKIPCSGPHALLAMGWETLLQRWAWQLNYYDASDQHPRDIAYWYGEQALNGLLAAAAWSTPGGWSLQEFTGDACLKEDDDELPEAGKKPSTRRRGDMWLGFEKPEDTFLIEAKLAWLESTVNQAVQKIETKLERHPTKSARQQLITFSDTHLDYCAGCLPMAVVYAVLRFPDDSRSASDHRIERLFTEVPKGFDSSTTVTAVYQCRRDWPTPTQYPTYPDNNGAKYVYPGVIFIGRCWPSFTVHQLVD